MTQPPPAKGSEAPTGLTGDEARRRLDEFGPNTIPDAAMRPWRRALAKFWAPVPWMLEAAVVLEISLGRYVEAAIIAVPNATDVAKSAAGIVLTKPGLAGIVASIKEGRSTFQRILTYALNSVTKKTVQALFLGVCL